MGSRKHGTTTTTTSTSRTLLTKKASPALQESSGGGIVGETMDVWSEFLGLKKTKYNIQAEHLDEDSHVDETDDEKGGADRSRRGKNKKNKSFSSSSLRPPTRLR